MEKEGPAKKKQKSWALNSNIALIATRMFQNLPGIVITLSFTTDLLAPGKAEKKQTFPLVAALTMRNITTILLWKQLLLILVNQKWYV